MVTGAANGFDGVGFDVERVVAGDGVSGAGVGEECYWCFGWVCDGVCDHLDDGCNSPDWFGCLVSDIDRINSFVGYPFIEWWGADFGLQG